MDAVTVTYDNLNLIISVILKILRLLSTRKYVNRVLKNSREPIYMLHRLRAILRQTQKRSLLIHKYDNAPV